MDLHQPPSAAPSGHLSGGMEIEPSFIFVRIIQSSILATKAFSIVTRSLWKKASCLKLEPPEYLMCTGKGV